MTASATPEQLAREIDTVVEDLRFWRDDVYKNYSGVIGDLMERAATEITLLRNELEVLMTADAPPPDAISAAVDAAYEDAAGIIENYRRDQPETMASSGLRFHLVAAIRDRARKDKP